MAADDVDAVAWERGLDALVERIAPHFARVEARRRALAYLKGLLAPVERKNGWQLAQAAGDRTPDGVQDFLARMRWDAEAVRDDLCAYVVEHLGEADAVLVLDETEFAKKGAGSVGVQRQYSSMAGRAENCQIGVFLGYTSRYGHALIDRALYLPKSWADDPQRQAKAGVPEPRTFASKSKLGRTMLERAFEVGVPCAWVTGDSVYGSDYALRHFIERRGCGYVLEVTRAQRLGLRPVVDWLEAVPAQAWQRLSAGTEAKESRIYEWVYLPYRSDTASGWQKGLLVRRRKLTRPRELRFYLTHSPQSANLAELVRVAGIGSTIEAIFEAARSEVGLDHYEVRSWCGWYRHITLAMFAHAYLGVVRSTADGKGKPG